MKKREWELELQKIITLAVAIKDPDNVYNEVIKLQKFLFPEIEDVLAEHDKHKREAMEEEQKYVWKLRKDKMGISAKRVPIEELPMEHQARQVQGKIDMRRKLNAT